MGYKNQIKAGAIISYLAIIFNVIAGLIYTPWMVSKIGKADYGLYTLATSIVAYFAMDFGFGGAISKYIAEFRAEHQEDKINNLLGIVYKFFFILDIIFLIALIVIYCFLENIFVSLTPDEMIKFRNIFLIVGAFSLISFPCTTFNGILIAYEKFIVLKLCDLANKVFVVIFMIIALNLGYGLYSLVIVNVAVQLLINIIKYIGVTQTVKGKINFRFFDKGMVKMIFSFSVWMTVMSISQRFIMNITPSVLGITSSAGEISVFSIGNTIEGYVYTFASALNSLFLAKVSCMVADNVTREQIMELMVKVGRIQLIIIGGIIIIFCAMGQEFINLWMGESFENSYFVTMLMIVPSIITLTQDIGYTLLIAENKIKYRAYCYILAAIISVSISFVLSQKYGAIGSAVGICTGTVVGHIFAMNYVFQKKCGLNMKRFFGKCHVKMLPILLVVFISGVFLQKYFIALNLFQFGVKIIILGIEYLLLIYIFFMNDFEKKLISGAIGKILQKITIFRREKNEK